MAHVAKIKSSGVSPMLGHYERKAEAKGYERENIDPERTHLNYAVGFKGGVHALSRAVKERVSEAVRGHEAASGKALRKDANVVMDWVITRPRDCPEELTEAFFASSVKFIQERYGDENVPGGYVHLDETTPHMHVPVVPVKNGKLQASKVINRADLQSFHKDLADRIEHDLGVRLSIELAKDDHLDRALYHADSQEQFKAARDAALSSISDEMRAAEERLERLRGKEEELAREVEELEPAAESFAESARYLAQHRGDGEREASLAREVGQLRERVGDLDRGVRELRASHRTLRERFEELGGRLAAVMKRLGEVPDYISDLALDLAHSLGIGTFDPVSRMLENAERAAAQHNQSHRGWDELQPRRGWGRSR